MKLNENYNHEEFIDWISDFLPDFSKDIRIVEVSKSFQGIKSIQTLGESSLGVRVYTIETEQDPSRRKVGLAKESFSLLRDYGTPNAIIVYYSKNSPLWRLSLLTSTLTWTAEKISKKLSNPKRQSYVLGSKAKVKTPHQYLISKGNIVDFSDLKSRFSLEVVNKEFYKEISHSFIQLVGGSIVNGKSKKSVAAQLKLPLMKDQSQTGQEFTVRLIGRIIFCWFLREKRSAFGYSLMPKELLSFEASNTIEDYYHKILEPIFFEVLNKPIKTRKETFVNELFSAIPYLNGGLFSPHEDDFFHYNEGKQAINHDLVTVPDQWLKALFEVLETYNFTIDENTSFDEELSIDPEMLGRIFENLLAEINPEVGESARKSTGSYYTPRVIVDYMIDESLYLYLKEKTNISEDKLRSLISYDLDDDISNPINDEEKAKIAQSLGGIKILDPACGSGAFPIGALQKIVYMLQQIDKHGQLWFKKQIQNTPIELRKIIEREFKEKNFDYIRKLGIIRENIYGIDIQPIATEISRLRCFLTLVVDERIDDTLENRGIEPLPNLDFKFVTANSLVGLPKATINQPELFDDTEKIDQLKNLREQYFTARSEERKDLMISFSELQSEMINELIEKYTFTGAIQADLTRKLTEWKPFKHKRTDWFDPEWMFGIKEGFDMVISNPPYSEIRDFPADQQLLYKNSRYFEYARGGRLNLFQYFYPFAISSCKDSAVICLITQNSILGEDSALNNRKYILENTKLIKFASFPERDNVKKRVFEGVKMSVCIGFLQKKKITSKDYSFNIEVWYDRYMKDGHVLNLNIQDIICTFPKKLIFPLSTTQSFLILKKLLQTKNDFSLNTKSGEIDMTKYSTKFNFGKVGRRVITGAQVQRYKITDTPSQGKVCYLADDKCNISSDKFNDSTKDRIVMQRITGVDSKARLIMTVIDGGILCANSTNYISGFTRSNLLYLVAVLNSKLINYIFKQTSTNTNITTSEINNIPIPDSAEEKGRLEKLVSFLIVNGSNEEAESEINNIVYRIYGLNDQEINIIEKT